MICPFCKNVYLLAGVFERCAEASARRKDCGAIGARRGRCAILMMKMMNENFPRGGEKDDAEGTGAAADRSI